jgi:(R,R)-butanediol dehydrogenase / meso-butanediol dehydrogenase / diacetyl reductase
MRALVWHGPRRMSVEELPDPEPGPGEVLLAPLAAGICGSDLEGYLGVQANRTPPLVMGHELAGRVVALGAGVDPAWRGRRAAVNPLVAGDDALAGIEQLSTRRQLIGVHRPGGFASVVSVPATRLRALPEGADPRLGALAEPFANGVHAARIGRAGPEGGPVERSVVIGAGTIGLMTLQAVVLGGSPWTAVIEPQADRRAVAERLGASAVYESEDALAVAVGESGVDVAFDAVGAATTRRLALQILRPGGCAVMVGLAAGETSLDFRDVVRRGLTIRGAYAYTDADYDEALAWLVDGRAGLGELEPVQPLDAGPDAFAELAAGASSRVKVFLAEPA